MGWLDSIKELGRSVVDAALKVVDTVKTVAEEMTSSAIKIVEKVGGLVLDGKFREAAEVTATIWEDTGERITATLKEAAQGLLAVGEKLFGVAFETVEQIIDGVGTAVRVVVDLLAKHPRECAAIAFGLVEIVAGFAAGNIPAGIAAIGKVVLKAHHVVGMEVASAASPEEAAIIMDKYSFSSGWEEVSGKFGDTPFDEIDATVDARFESLLKSDLKAWGFDQPFKKDGRLAEIFRTLLEKLSKHEVSDESKSHIDLTAA